MYCWPDKHERAPLPIDEKLPEILKLINQHQIVVCEAETGAGKTTRIGQAAILADPNLRVVMTQTRRNACRWNGQRIAMELHCAPGQLVGWRLANENPLISLSTRLELTIDQSLVQRIRREKALPKGLIIIDEAHERSLSIDLLLGLLKEQLPRSPETRILIVSATIDTKKFSAFFNNAPVIHIKGQCHPVTTRVEPLQHGEHHTEGAIRVAGNLIDRFLQKQMIVYDSNQRSIVITKGTILILLPGKEDINDTLNGIRAAANHFKATNGIELFSCHGESTAEEQNLVQQPVPANTLRFVCGTEVLRSSVTVTETVGVIDSLQIKRLITHTNGIGELTKIPVSKAEAEQAKGRAGRTAPGFYIAISFNDQYAELAPWPQPAIMREPLSHLVLQIAAISCSIRKFIFIDAPSLEKLDVTIERLKILGALAEAESITPLGEKLVNLPLTPELAKVLITANELGVLPEAIIVTATLEVEGIFQLAKLEGIQLVDDSYVQQILSLTRSNPAEPPKWITKKDDNSWEINCNHPEFPNTKKGFKWLVTLFRKRWAGESQSDFVAMVSAYREFCAKRKTVKKQHEKELKNWCMLRGLNYKRICQAEDKMKQIIDAPRLSSILTSVNYYELVNDRSYTQIALSKALVSAKMDDIAFQQTQARSEYVGKIGNFSLAFESICPVSSEIILIYGINKIPINVRGQTMHRIIATHAAPLEPLWLYEMLPHLCTCKRSGDYQYNATQNQIVETEIIYFQSHLLFRRLVAPDHQLLARWLTDRCDNVPSTSNNSQISLFYLDEREINHFLHAQDPLTKILRTNCERQTLARSLNARVNQTVFKVFTKEELIKFFEARLTGARTTAQTTPLQDFLLPALDATLVKKILVENPDQIIIDGYRYKVEYPSPISNNVMPRIMLSLDHLQEEYVLKLFITPIKLSGGRSVEIAFENKFVVKWDIQDKVDLAQSDLSGVKLLKVDLRNANCFKANLRKTNLTYTKLKGANLAGVSLEETLFVEDLGFYRFTANSDELNQLPYFLSRDEMNNREQASNAFSRLLTSKLSPSQLEYIKWSLVMQFINEGHANNSISGLRWLKDHPILTRAEYTLKLYRNLGSLFSSAMSFFGSSTKVSTYGEQSMQEKIQEAIAIIEKKPGYTPGTASLLSVVQ